MPTLASRVYTQDQDAEAKELLRILPMLMHKERTSTAIVNTVLMAGLSPAQFFDVLRQNWCTWEGREATHFLNPVCQQAEYPGYEGDGFVSLPYKKLLCVGCGGVVELPDFSTPTLVHALLEPRCMAFLSERDFSERQWGKIMHSLPTFGILRYERK